MARPRPVNLDLTRLPEPAALRRVVRELARSQLYERGLGRGAIASTIQRLNRRLLRSSALAAATASVMAGSSRRTRPHEKLSAQTLIAILRILHGISSAFVLDRESHARIMSRKRALALDRAARILESSGCKAEADIIRAELPERASRGRPLSPLGVLRNCVEAALPALDPNLRAELIRDLAADFLDASIRPATIRGTSERAARRRR